jgi:hypothetical protein
MTVPAPVTVTNGSGVGLAGRVVYAYIGSTYAGSSRTTNASGQALFQLLPGSYRFKLVVGTVSYWSGPSSTCTLPGSTTDSVVVP